MSPFNFHAIQTLELDTSDNPNIDVQNGRLILTASRGEDQIMITAPLNSVVPVAVQTTVKAPRRAKKRNHARNHSNHPKGENHSLAKLTEASVREMRALAADESYMASFPSKYAAIKELADVFKVHFTTVSKILDGKTWKHIL
jgi:hypothetical protein